MRDLDAFVQARLEEPAPPMVSAARTPGYRPRPEEDPLNAWTWKCRIAGAADGVLAGKTVSFKDHIAVAGMPMSFGSFALDGFVPDFDATVVTRVLEAGRRNYHGRVYAKAQNVRPAYIKAYDAALADVDVLVMPTCLMTAPKNQRAGSYLEAVEENLTALSRGGSRNTQPFNYTGHPALALPVGKSSAGLPVSMQIVGRFFDDPLVMRVGYAFQQASDWKKIIGVRA